MIGICPPGSIPSRGVNGAFRIIHHLLRSASRTSILADRLLGEDWCKPGAADRGDVTGRGEPKAVAKAEGWRETERRKHVYILAQG
jgi:hypothetical protein